MSDFKAGDEIKLALGKESFYPAKYHLLELGEIGLTIKLKEGDDAKERIAKAQEFLANQRAIQFKKQLPLYIARIKECRGIAATAGGDK